MCTTLSSGEMANIVRIPMSAAIPAFGIFYSAQVATDMKFSEEEIYYEFDPYLARFIKENTYEILPSINTEFEGKMTDGRALTLIVDENAANCYLRQLQNLDKMYSLKEFVLKDPRLK